MFGKDKIFFYLKPDDIKVFLPKSTENLYLGGLVNFQEILDSEKFIATFSEFLNKIKVKGEKIAIIVDEALIFKKEISKEDPRKLEEESELFSPNQQADDTQMAALEIDSKENLTVLITNGEYFKTVSDQIEKAGGKVSEILPITELGELAEKSDFTYEEAKAAIGKVELDKINLLNETKIEEDKTENKVEEIVPEENPESRIEPEKPETVVETEKQAEEIKPEEEKRQTPWLWIILGVIFIATLIGLFAFRESFIKGNLTNKVEPTPIPTIMPTPTIPEKVEIKIQVLNASGKTGEAGKIKTQLEALGFTSVETGNSEIESGATTLQYINTLSADYRQEIITELEKSYTDLEKEEVENQDFDIIITIKK